MLFGMPNELLIEDACELKIRQVWNSGERSEIEEILWKVISIYNNMLNWIVGKSILIHLIMIIISLKTKILAPPSDHF